MTLPSLRSLLLIAAVVLLSPAEVLAQDDDLPEPPPSTVGEPDPLDDLPEAPPPEAELQEGEEPPTAVAPPERLPPDGADLEIDETLPDGDLDDIPDQAPPPDGGLLEIVFTGDIAELRLKGPDGMYYTPGRLRAGRYVLGIRYAEKEDWVRFTFDLAEGRETRIDCDVSTRDCGVRSRVWKP